MKRYAGFTLLELVIAVFILAAAVLTFVQVLRGSRSQLVMTGHTFAANHVSMKVNSDLLEDARINGNLLELLEEFPEMVGTDKVVDAQSIYFRYIQDRTPPLGVLEPGKDGGVVPDDEFLYNQLQPFTLKVRGERQKAPGDPDFRRHIAEVGVSVDWQEKGGPERNYSLTAHLSSPVGPRPFDEVLLFEEDKIPDLARDFLFPFQKNHSLRETAVSAKADPDMLLACGSLAVVTLQMEAGIASISKKLQTLESRRQQLLSNPTPELADVQLKIGRQLETGTCLVFHVLRTLEPRVKAIEAAFDRKKFGWVDFNRAVSGIWRFGAFSRTLINWLQRSGREYEWLLSDSLLAVRSRRTEEFARMKALEAFRLLAALEPAKKPVLQEFIARQTQRLTGHNPSWERTMIREGRLLNDPVRLRKIFGNLAEICRVYEEKISPAAEFALTIPTKK